MIDNEHKFQDKMVEFIRNTTRAYVHVNVGSTMSAGQPDLTIYNNSGRVWLVENKCWRLKSLPTNDTMRKLLKGPQVNVIIHQLWSRNIYAPIVAIDMYHLDQCHVHYKDKLMTADWKAWVTNECKV